MFKKLINRSESGQVELNDSVLRDIIPSNDVDVTKKPQKKRFSSVCKILICMFILGVIAIGIVVLGLILAYSGKFFMNFIKKSTDGNLIQFSNKTRAFPLHQENLTEISNEQDWKKITLIPTDNNQQVHIPSSLMRSKQESSQAMKSYPSLNTTVHEQTTSTTTQTTTPNRQSTITIKKQEFVQTSLDNKITTADTLTSSLLIHKIRNHEITTSEKIPLSSFSKRQMLLNKYKQIEDDNIMNDLLFS